MQGIVLTAKEGITTRSAGFSVPWKLSFPAEIHSIAEDVFNAGVSDDI